MKKVLFIMSLVLLFGFSYLYGDIDVKYSDIIFSLGMQDEVDTIASPFLSIKKLVVIVDSGNNKLYWLNMSGNIVRRLGQGGDNPGEFSEPQDLWVDKEGNIYVTDTGNNRIQVFNKKGAFQYQFGKDGDGNKEFQSPTGICMSKKGNLYIADKENNRIQVFTKKGEFLFKFGNEGESEGEFESPVSVAVDENDLIYVADKGNHRIQIFDKDGIFIKKFGSEGKGDGQFDELSDIYYDEPSGLLFITDKGNNKIHIYDKQGNYIKSFGKEGESESSFDSPQGIMISEDGQIFIADTGNSRVQVFSLSRQAKKVKKIENTQVVAKKEEPKPEKIVPPTKKQLIAIFNLENVGKEAQESDYGSVFAYSLYAEFDNSGYFNVADKDSVKNSIKKNNLNNQPINQKNAAVIGKDLNLGAAVIGTVTKVKEAITVDVKVINTLSEEKVVSVTKEISKEAEIRDTCKNIVQEIVRYYFENDKKKLEVPSGLRTEVGKNDILIKWDEGTDKDIAGYQIYRAEKADGDYKLIGSSGSTSFKDTTVVPGKDYFYKITAVNLYGFESDFSIFKSDKINVKYVTVTAGQENIRENGKGTKKIGSSKIGDKLIYLGEEKDGYVKVQMSDGKVGWIWKKSVTIEE